MRTELVTVAHVGHMRTGVWYPLVGYAVLAWLALVVEAAITVPFPKVWEWISWLITAFAMLLSLRSGSYATKDTWPEGILKKIVAVSPVLELVIGIGLIVLVVFAILAVTPRFTTVAIGAGLVAGVWFAPMVVKDSLPPGKVANGAAAVVGSGVSLAQDLTPGWFAGTPTTAPTSKAPAKPVRHARKGGHR